MKVLVTEANTFLGQLIFKKVNKKGLELVPYTGQSFPSLEDKIDACVFLYNPHGSRSEVVARNHHIPKQLLRKLHEINCNRFITVSPIDVYGLKRTCDDGSNSLLQPNTALGESCYNLERIIKDCRELWGATYACLRLANLFGAEEKELPPEEQSFVYKTLQKIKEKQPTIEANNRSVPWVSTTAFLEVLQCCLTKNFTGTMNVSCAASRDQNSVAATIAYFMGRRPNIVAVPTQEFDQIMTTELLDGHFGLSFDLESQIRNFVIKEVNER